MIIQPCFMSRKLLHDNPLGLWFQKAFFHAFLVIIFMASGCWDLWEKKPLVFFYLPQFLKGVSSWDESYNSILILHYGIVSLPRYDLHTFNNMALSLEREHKSQPKFFLGLDWANVRHKIWPTGHVFWVAQPRPYFGLPDKFPSILHGLAE